MRGTVKTWGLVANALAFLLTASAAPRAFAQQAGATTPALTPPKVSKFVEAKRPEGTAPDGATVDLELTIGADGVLTDVQGRRPGERGAGRRGAGRRPAVHVRAGAQGRSRGARTHPLSLHVRAVVARGAGRARRAAAQPGAAAPQVRPGRLEGKILARAGSTADQPIAGATVTLLTATGEAVSATLAGETGSFAFPELAPRAYHLRVEAEGFAPVEADEAVTAGEATTITYRLESVNAKKATSFSFGATASIDAPPREVTKRTLTPEELLRTAGTRGDPLARHRDAARRRARAGPGRASSSSAAPRPLDSQAYFENGLVDRIYHFGGLTSFVNRAAARAASSSTRATSRPATAARSAASSTSAVRDPRTDGVPRHAVDVNLIDAAFLVEGPVGKRGGFAARRQAQLRRLLVQEGRARGRRSASPPRPVYWDYQGIYSYKPRERRSAAA